MMISCAVNMISTARRNASTSKTPPDSNLRRLRLDRLQAELSRCIYSLQGLEPLMRPALGVVCQSLMVVSYCMPGSAHSQAAWAIWRMRSRALRVFFDWPSSTPSSGKSSSRMTACMKSSLTRTELLAFWYCTDAESRPSRSMSKPASRNARALTSSRCLHQMNSSMSGWSTSRITILAARRVFPPDLMVPAEASAPRMKLTGPEAVPPPFRCSTEERMRDRLTPEPDPPLKIVPSSTYQLRMELIRSSTERMKQAEHCGVSSVPQLNHTGELKAARWVTSKCLSSAETFNAELKHLLVTQRAAFNSPVWFNCGTEDTPQCSACFILSVEDRMSSILNWYVEEGTIFKGGSGSGVNLSRIRSSVEHLKGGGTASGPVSFMRGADASAGTIKSGGKTRRAAKMVILDVDHPDIEEFIWCKQREEVKARALREAGFDMDLDGLDSASVQYQNANNSVRVNDDFMHAVTRDDDFSLLGVLDGQPKKTLKARDLMRQIAQAAWECADPGMQYDTTINDWHTTPNAGRINGSNPCSEYMHLDNSACNLSSLNLRKFESGGVFDVEAFRRAVEIMFTAQEIIIGNSSYPTEKIGDNARAYRQLGLGYANLGGLLMSQGLAYDSPGGRAWAAAITALMTGHAYRTSAELARVQGPFEGYEADRDGMLRVIAKHRDSTADIDAALAPANILAAAQQSWDEALEMGTESGIRNAQASVLAPTGTIGLMMDCDTTGIEPDLGLVKFKKMVGGGSMRIINRTVPVALEKLGYQPEQIEAILAYIDEHATIEGAPAFKPEHLEVFDCAMGERSISPMGHVAMMAAVQPFISGAISKTVNLPESATVEDVEQLYRTGWELGLKAVAI